jgi:hypothetical protein
VLLESLPGHLKANVLSLKEFEFRTVTLVLHAHGFELLTERFPLILELRDETRRIDNLRVLAGQEILKAGFCHLRLDLLGLDLFNVLHGFLVKLLRLLYRPLYLLDLQLAGLKLGLSH